MPEFVASLTPWPSGTRSWRSVTASNPSGFSSDASLGVTRRRAVAPGQADASIVPRQTGAPHAQPNVLLSSDSSTSRL